MATHNQVRAVGYALNDPRVYNEGMAGAEKVMFTLRTVHREFDGFVGQKFEDLLIYYDGTDFIEKAKAVRQFDLLDIKGVVNIAVMTKRFMCPHCGAYNYKPNGSRNFIYPITFSKLNRLVQEARDENEVAKTDADGNKIIIPYPDPDMWLVQHYEEVSNQAFILGTVVNDPVLFSIDNKVACKYMLGIDRKYYIPSQGDITADYPWVYSFGQQAERDAKHLKVGTLVLIDGFIQNKQYQPRRTCTECGQAFSYNDVATEIVPYAVEYLNNYITDEELAQKALGEF